MASKRKKSRSKKKGDRSVNAAAEVREPESTPGGDEAPAPKAKTDQRMKEKSRKAKKKAAKAGPKGGRSKKRPRSKAKNAPSETPTTEAAAPDPATPTPEAAPSAHDLDGVLDEAEAEDVDRLIAAAAGDVPGDPGDAAQTLEPDPSATDEAPTPRDEAATGDAAREAGVVAGEAESEPPLEEEEEEEEAEDLDLGPTSTPEARARILAAALAHAEMQEARYRVPTARSTVARLKAALALTFFALAGLLAIAPPSIVVPEPLPSLTAADRLEGVRLALLLQAEQIEAFRAREERLPRSLDEVATHVPGIRFVRSGSRLYQLIAYTPEGRAVVYDSSAPAPEFHALEPSWRSAGGS